MDEKDTRESDQHANVLLLPPLAFCYLASLSHKGVCDAAVVGV